MQGKEVWYFHIWMDKGFDLFLQQIITKTMANPSNKPNEPSNKPSKNPN